MGSLTRKTLSLFTSLAVHAGLFLYLLDSNNIFLHAKESHLVEIDIQTTAQAEVAPVIAENPVPPQAEAVPLPLPKPAAPKAKPVRPMKAKSRGAPKVAAPVPDVAADVPEDQPIAETKDDATDADSSQPENNEPPTPMEVVKERPEAFAAETEEVQEAQTPIAPAAAPFGQGSEKALPMIEEAELEPMPGNVKPEYSYMAKLQNMEGTTVLRAFVNKDGHMNAPVLEKSSGHGHLDELAIKAFAQWRWVPGPSGWLRKSFVFKFRDSKANKISKF